MSIWQRKYDVLSLNARGKNTLVEYLDIQMLEVGDDYIKASMPVDQRTHQPLGILHGGASVVLAESVGSIAANMALTEAYYAVGLDINANHIKAVRSGFVFGVAKPVHLGRSTHVWGIEISNQDGQITCVSRLTMAVLQRDASDA